MLGEVKQVGYMCQTGGLQSRCRWNRCPSIQYPAQHGYWESLCDRVVWCMYIRGRMPMAVIYVNTQQTRPCGQLTRLGPLDRNTPSLISCCGICQQKGISCFIVHADRIDSVEEKRINSFGFIKTAYSIFVFNNNNRTKRYFTPLFDEWMNVLF